MGLNPFTRKAGETYRVSFVWWQGEAASPEMAESGPRFVGGRRFDIPGVGPVLDTDPALAAFATGPSVAAFATILAVWPTDTKGNLDKTRFANGDVDVKPWVLPQDGYDQVMARNEEWPYCDHDLSISDTPKSPHKMIMGPCRENLYRLLIANPKARTITDKIQANVIDVESGIRDLVGRRMTVDEVRAALANPVPRKPSFPPGLEWLD